MFDDVAVGQLWSDNMPDEHLFLVVDIEIPADRYFGLKTITTLCDDGTIDRCNEAYFYTTYSLL